MHKIPHEGSEDNIANVTHWCSVSEGEGIGIEKMELRNWNMRRKKPIP